MGIERSVAAVWARLHAASFVLCMYVIRQNRSRWGGQAPGTVTDTAQQCMRPLRLPDRLLASILLLFFDVFGP